MNAVRGLRPLKLLPKNLFLKKRFLGISKKPIAENFVFGERRIE